MHKISKPVDPAIVFNEVRKTFQLKHTRSFKETATSLLKGQVLAENFNALNDVSFTVLPGESVAVMGHNGSGKSTTLKLLSGVLRPTGGWIRTQGRVAGLIEVGAGFHPDLTGRENVYLNAAILGMSKEETDARFDEIVEFAEVGRFIDTEVKRYSSGMYARLGFSVAVHTELDILLVDEVLSVGDTAFRDKCNAKMAELQSQGKTMFIVSHSMGQVKKLCQRGLVLDHGNLVFDGPIDEAVDIIKPKKHSKKPVSIEVDGFEYNRVGKSGVELTKATHLGSELSLVLPPTVQGEPLVSIGQNAFARSKYRRIVLPESVTQIKRGAFFKADQLEEVSLPNTLRAIGPGAFRGCSSLAKVDLPEGLERIEPRAFLECSALKEITLPRTVTHLASGVFGGRKDLLFKCYEGTPAASTLAKRVPETRIHIIRESRRARRESLLAANVSIEATPGTSV